MRVGLLGAGSWGCALAELLCQNRHTILWWVHRTDIADSIRKTGKHPFIFPEHSFPPERIEQVTTNLTIVSQDADLIILALPSRYIASALQEVAIPQTKPWLSGTKGLLPEKALRPTEYLRSRGVNQVAILSGPSYAEEVIAHRPTWVGLGTELPHLYELAHAALATSYFHLIPTSAVNALEWIGILKNIYAIGIGAISLIGDNARAALASAMLRELSQVLSAWAPEEAFDFLSPAWVGDFLVTAFGTLSRNQRLGQYLAQGYSPRTALNRLGMVAEGYYAAQILFPRITPNFPILYSIVRVLSEKDSPETLRQHLMNHIGVG
ncbi:MAG: hypothetical protein N3E49_06310 [Bacteroidia bacterium]|nr:hypothetical protein [Bacteroidia bacterium]